MKVKYYFSLNVLEIIIVMEWINPIMKVMKQTVCMWKQEANIPMQLLLQPVGDQNCAPRDDTWSPVKSILSPRNEAMENNNIDNDAFSWSYARAVSQNCEYKLPRDTSYSPPPMTVAPSGYAVPEDLTSFCLDHQWKE